MAAFINRETALAIRRGAAGAAPIVMGYIPIGFAFGVLAAEAGIDLVGAAAMSVFVFAGSAQFIAIGLMASGCSIAALGMTVFLVNLRHLLMSAALAPYLGRFKRWQQVLFCFRRPMNPLRCYSANLHARAAPVPADDCPESLRPYLLDRQHPPAPGSAAAIRFDTALFGLDYALPAMFIAR